MVELQLVGTAEAQMDTFHVATAIYQLEKSYLLLVTDQPQFGIGTVSLSAPPSIPGTGAVSAPFSLFGLKHNTLAGLAGRIASQKLNLPVLTLLFIKQDEQGALKQELVMKTTMESVLGAINMVVERQRKHSDQTEKTPKTETK